MISTQMYQIYHTERDQWLTNKRSNMDGTVIWSYQWSNETSTRVTTNLWGECTISYLLTRTMPHKHNSSYNLIQKISLFLRNTGGWDNVIIVPFLNGQPNFMKAMETAYDNVSNIS